MQAEGTPERVSLVTVSDHTTTILTRLFAAVPDDEGQTVTLGVHLFRDALPNSMAAHPDRRQRSCNHACLPLQLIK